MVVWGLRYLEPEGPWVCGVLEVALHISLLERAAKR